MKAVVVTIAFALALGMLVLPAVVPALGTISPAGDAEASRCIIGSNWNCIITINCLDDVRECDPPR